MHDPTTISRGLRRARPAILAIALTLASLPALALEVTGAFTAWWGQPDQQNHGLIISVSELPSGEKTAAMFWAHYIDGEPSWLFAQGDIDGDTINADVYRFEGINFMDPPDPDGQFGEVVGTMDVQFADCDNGHVVFDTSDPETGAGEFDIVRLTNQPGTDCTGGISDDEEDGELPQHFEIDLVPTDIQPDASGTAEFESSPGAAAFTVEVEDLIDGTYELRVGEDIVGAIEVIDGEGEIEFRSPQIEGTELLDFDPRDQIIDVLGDGEVVLTGLAPEQGDFPGNGPPPFDTPAIGTLDIEVDFVNDGVYPEGSADAEFEMAGNRVAFDIRVFDVPAGTYPVFVGGIKRGDLEVTEDDDGETSGELEWRFPPTGDQAFFDFDPRGQTIEIFEATTRIFHVDFPDEQADDGRPGDGEVRIDLSLELDNLGVHPDASATADYSVRGARREFEVEVEDAPVGVYQLAVGGEVRADVEVIEVGDGTRGSVELVVPGGPPGAPMLNFDPRGQLVEILEDGTAILSGTFPDED
ncbi:MAG: hypothetical protein R3323_00735 [Wenzhouxiangellaceae bacterium]|nr:hypothetical protein [Wenzhouxiangellaceae bacterium]